MRGSDRWVEVTSSQFGHENEGLDFLAAVVPDVSPYRVWTNFEFRDSQGRWHECDAMVLTPSTLYLIELKYYSGTLTGDDLTWRRGGRTEDSPLKLARRKAQRLASKLKDQCRAWLRAEFPRLLPKEVDAKVRQIVPFVKEAVFLHHPGFVCQLPQSSCQDLYGLDGHSDSSNLPGISELVLAAPRKERIGENAEHILAELMKRIGLVQRRERVVGSWVIEETPIGEGMGWQEWLVNHRYEQTQRGKARIYTSASEAQLATQRRLVKHEFASTNRLRHESIETPRDYVECEQGPALIFDLDEGATRLDLWLKGVGREAQWQDRLKVVCQVAEAIHYAHGQGLAHRQLTPAAVSVSGSPLLARVGNWVLAGSADASSPAVTKHSSELVESSDDSPWAGFFAPEAQWADSYDRTRADVFSVGVLAYFVMSGKVPAGKHQDLVNRLKQDGCLDVSRDAPDLGSHIVEAIRGATCSAVAKRTSSLADFVAALTTVPEPQMPVEVLDPAEATPGTTLDGRFTVIRRLGQGATSVALLVDDNFAEGKAKPVPLVLKVLTSDDDLELMQGEAEQLEAIGQRKLKNVVQLKEGPIPVGNRSALLLSSAGDRTLSDVMTGSQHLPLELLNKFGSQLLQIVADLERISVFHRDIKPANLGVSARNVLTLFDFSLAKAAARQVTAGTRAYLDPFLGSGERDVFDYAAERYSAAVVLFELATGRRPCFGDGVSDPAAISDEASVSAQDFDPVLADGLVGFFRKCLARDAKDRFPDARAMQSAWQRIFTDEVTTQAVESHDSLAEVAVHSTRLVDSGLTPSALSVTRLFSLETVADFLICGSDSLTRSAKHCSRHTQSEIRKRFNQWKKSLGLPETEEQKAESVKSDWDVLRRALRSAKGSGKSVMPLAKLIFGLGGDVSPFAANKDLGAELPKGASQARVGQLWSDMLAIWDTDADSRRVLQRWESTVCRHVDELGGVARTESVLESVLRDGPGRSVNGERAYTYGLIRVAVFALMRSRGGPQEADSGDKKPYFGMNRKHGFVLLSTVDGLSDVVIKSAPRLDRLFGRGKATRDDLISPAAAVLSIREDVDDRVAKIDWGSGSDTDSGEDRASDSESGPLAKITAALANDVTMVRLVAAAASEARATSRGGVHHRDLSAARAVEFVIDGWAATHRASLESLREEVAQVFPCGPELPYGDDLVKLVASLPVQWKFDGDCFVSPEKPSSDTDLATATSFSAHVGSASTVQSDGDVLTPRMVSSIQRREFVAFSVPALAHAQRFVELVCVEFGAQEFNVSRALIEGLRGFADQHGADWRVVLASDASGASAHDQDLLRQAMSQVASSVCDRVAELMAIGDAGPLLLTDVGLLFRFGHDRLVTELADISRSRSRPVWLVLPNRDNLPSTQVGDDPLRLSVKNQSVRVDRLWLASRRVKESA